MATRKYTPEEARERKNRRQIEYNKATKYAAQAKYHKLHSKVINIRVISPQDNDIIDYLDALPNKSGYIKALIREDIAHRENL